MDMDKRYALRVELDDSTLTPPFASYGNRRTAIGVARQVAASPPRDGVRIWVDDTRTEIGIRSFDCAAAAEPMPGTAART